MNPEKSPGVLPFLPSALFLMILGWSGLYFVGRYTTPNGGTRWLLFFTGVLAVVGTILPLVAFLNHRFPSTPVVSPRIVVRQALWVGVYAAVLGWLQIGRVLTPALALLMAVGLLLIEWLLRLRERSQWKP